MFRRALQLFPFPLAIADSQGAIRGCNAAWVELTGLNEDTLLPNALVVVSAENENKSSAWSQILQRIEKRGESEAELTCKEFRLQILLNKVQDKMNELFVVRLETQSKAKIEIAKVAHEERLNDMAEMAAGIAHEITNPLTIIAAKSEMLKTLLSTLPAESAAQAMKFASGISSQCLRITKIVRAMRSFSRGGYADSMVNTSVSRIVEESLALCYEKSRHRGTKFNLEPVPENLMVNCRPVQVTQIIVNLLNNAIDATEDIALPEVKIGVRLKQDFVEILVSDNGKGVPIELESRIFDPFYTTKQVGKGTGIGLSLSRRLSHENGGSLYLDRSVSQSCFILSLPQASQEKSMAS